MARRSRRTRRDDARSTGPDQADGRPRASASRFRNGRSPPATWRSSCGTCRIAQLGLSRRVAQRAARRDPRASPASSAPAARELAETLFGLTPADGGEILVHGAPVRIGSPLDAIQLGIAYVPEDRRQHGVVLEMSVAANTSLASLGAVSRRGLIDRAARAAAAERYVERLRIKTPSVVDRGRDAVGRQPAEGRARALAVDRARRSSSSTSRRRASTSARRPRSTR